MVTLYVSTQGRDEWSGRLATPRADGSDGPLATLEKARDTIRAQRADGTVTGGAKIVVRGGTYRLADTFALDEQDSGTAEQPMWYVAYRGETPVLTGGAVVTGWRPYKGEILQADLAPLGLEFKGGGTPWTGWAPGKWVRDPIAQVFFRGKRQILARYPNLDPAAPWGSGFLYIRSLVGEGTKDRWLAAPEELHDWARASEGEVFMFPAQNYISECSKVASVNRETGEVVLADACWTVPRVGDRYYFQNLLEELDAPGEWYWDKEKNVLYFWPPEPIEEGEVVVPTLNTGVTIGDGASHVLFEGFTIEHLNGRGVAISGKENCVVARCTVRHVGGQGITIGGGQGNGAEGNDVYDTGSSAMTVSGGDRKSLTPGRNFAVNNHIYHMGVYRKGDSAISCSGCGNRIAHNEIHDIPRIGIIFSGNDHVVEYNHIHHCNLEIQDSGAIYLGGVSWTMRGNVIRYNLIHDTGGYGREGDHWAYPFYTWGIYLDDWASGAQVYGNIVARAYLAAVHVHSGRDNVIENNIFVDGERAQVQYSAWPTTHRALPDMFAEIAQMGWPKGRYPGMDRMRDPIADATMSFNVFRRNIVCYDSPNALLYSCHGLVSEEHTSDHNCIYNHGQPLLVNLPGVGQDEQWGKWREMGFEEHSIVADPQFVAPEEDDYRLRPTSPALRLGFKPIPVERVGCQASRYRASWPLEYPPSITHPELQRQAGERVAPRHLVTRRTSPIVVDGKMGPGEWQAEARTAMVCDRPPGNERGSRYKSYAWARYDDQNLYVLLVNEVDPAVALTTGEQWGAEDAAELAFRDPSREGAPIFNLRGFAGGPGGPRCGRSGSVCDAGASAEEAERLGAAVEFAATVEKGRWIGEWRIPLAAAGIDGGKVSRLQFNINVRRMADRSWMVWTDTGAEIWRVDKAGELVFVGRE